MSSPRGVVITPLLAEKPGESSGGPILDPLTLRKYLIYWDEIVLVHDVDIGGQLEVKSGDLKFAPELRMARDAGYLKMPMIYVEGVDVLLSDAIPAFYQQIQLRITNEFNTKGDGHWSIGQSVKRFQLPQEESFNKQTIITELSHALPVPDESVPISKILWFKRQHSDEFKAFREAYDGLYLEVLKQGDLYLALERAKHQLQTTLLELNEAMEKSSILSRFLSWQTLWKIPQPLINVLGVAGGLKGLFPDVPVPAALIAGLGLQASISLRQASISQPMNSSDKVRDFAYLWYVQNNL